MQTRPCAACPTMLGPAKGRGEPQAQPPPCIVTPPIHPEAIRLLTHFRLWMCVWEHPKQPWPHLSQQVSQCTQVPHSASSSSAQESQVTSGHSYAALTHHRR